jgi:hypothetical protein
MYITTQYKEVVPIASARIYYKCVMGVGKSGEELLGSYDTDLKAREVVSEIRSLLPRGQGIYAMPER